jgi:Leucine-rich repeat (LRR) protein
LEEITASSNQIKRVPNSFFNLKRLRHLNLVNNEIVSLLDDDVTEQFDMDDVRDEINWQCHSLKSLNLCRNQLKFIPLAIHAAHSLEKLHLSGNKLTSFPTGWKCPLVSTY